MSKLSIQLQKQVVMALTSIILLGSGCEDCLDTCGNTSVGEGTPVDVTFRIGLADEADAYNLYPSTTTKGSGAEALEARLMPAAVCTKSAADKPDKLYNLEILQYDASTGAKLNTASTIVSADLGSSQNVTLAASNDCQLLIVARGEDGTFPSIISKNNISQIRKASDMLVKAATSTINAISFGENANMNNMPYMLYIEHVKITKEDGTGYGIIQSIDGQNIDVRLLLERLAVRLDASWSISQDMQNEGYTLKEVRFSQVPVGYRYLTDKEETRWGTTYPSSTAEFIDLYRLKGDELTTAKSKKSIWLPINVRGTSPAATSLYYRNKENAPIASSYLEFVVDNATKLERLYYRVYVGGPRTTDFNLYGNTDYSYVVNINNANYRTDARIRLLDQTPVVSTNLIPASNCFMMKPGTNLCFNPYKHTSGTNGWNDELVNTPSGTPSIKSEIKKVKVLWQNKDNGTSGELVMGYSISETNHENLVHLVDGNNLANARIHVKVPVTNGGNALIAAYGTDETKALWSWHLWISDYEPVPLGAFTSGDADSRTAAIQVAQNATRGGIVQTYQGNSWTQPTGDFYNKVIMDRNLGAIRGVPTLNSNLESARTYGVLYQWGRKDPMPGSADGSPEEINTLFNADGEWIYLGKATSGGSKENAIANPSTFYGKIYLDHASWGPIAKTIYDPCPEGWRVPDFYDGNSGNSMMFDGFAVGASLLLLNNKTWYTGTINNPVTDATNGMLYKYPGEDQNGYTDKSVWFPMYWMREYNTGELRKSVACFVLYSAHGGSSLNCGYYTELKVTGTLLLVKGNVADKSYGMSVRCIQERE